jgi:hypothetical protein
MFRDSYKLGIENLSFVVARIYYNHFTTDDRWSTLTIQVLDFDSTSEDDLIGTVSVHLPGHLDLAAVEALSGTSCYEIQGHKAAKCGSMLDFSLSWSDFAEESRLFGSWILTTKHATNLPSMDPRSLTSDPYCTAIARNDMSESCMGRNVFPANSSEKVYRRVDNCTCGLKDLNLSPQVTGPTCFTGTTVHATTLSGQVP